MSADDAGRTDSSVGSDGHRTTWFVIDRPVVGGTVYARGEWPDEGQECHGDPSV